MPTPGTAFDALTLKILDGTSPTPLEVTVALVNGDLQLPQVQADMREAVAIACRGKLVDLVKGAGMAANAPPTFSVTALFSDFTDGTNETILDMMAGTNGYSARVTTNPTAGGKLTFKVTGSWAQIGGGTETFSFERVVLSVTPSESETGNVFAIEGTIYGDITLGDATFAAYD